MKNTLTYCGFCGQLSEGDCECIGSLQAEVRRLRKLLAEAQGFQCAAEVETTRVGRLLVAAREEIKELEGDVDACNNQIQFSHEREKAAREEIKRLEAQSSRMQRVAFGAEPKESKP